MPEWRFLEVRKGDKVRENVLSEFFNAESINNAGEALVREGIQNSLDAVFDESKPVRVRIVYGGDSEDGRTMAPSLKDAGEFFDGLAEHLHASGFETPDEGEPVKFIALEDFNTNGLCGDPSQWEKPDEHNPFFAFFRAEGWSQKEDGAGRWGVGKFAFPSASRFRTHFGLTIPRNDRTPLLVGQSVLKHHKKGDKTHMPDGWFGEFDETLGLPIEGDDPQSRHLITRFSECFNLKRRDEPGLSVVVPFLDEDATDYAKLLAGVVKDYYLPILQEKLVVELKHGDAEAEKIDREWLLSDAVDAHADELGGAELKAELKLANWFVEQRWDNELSPDIELAVAPKEGDGGPVWEDVQVTSSRKVESLTSGTGDDDDEQTRLRKEARRLLDMEQRLIARVSTHVFTKDSDASAVKSDPAEFFVVLNRDDDVGGGPTFFRHVLKVSDVRSRHPAGFRALVVVPAGPLGKLLGDAENPSHTSWSSRADTFVGKYKYGNNLIKLVRNSPYRFVSAIRGGDEFELDRVVLSGFFGRVPTDVGGPSTDNTDEVDDKDNPEKPEQSDTTDTTESLKTYVIEPDLAGGFSITSRQNEEVPAPESLSLRVAYDVSAGDPLKKHSRFDFDFRETGADMVSTIGCEYSVTGSNKLRFEEFENDFLIQVTGFDENRDLYISPRATNPEPADHSKSHSGEMQNPSEEEVTDGETV